MTGDGKLTIRLAVGMVTIGFVLMFIGWNGAAGVDTPQQQFPYLLSGTVPGLALTLTGLTLALVQEIRRTAARLMGHLAAAPPATASPEGPATMPAAVPTGDENHVVATSATYHDPDCHVVAGRSDLTPMDADTAEERGLSACRVCEPVADAAA